jgi:hypothetical protein
MEEDGEYSREMQKIKYRIGKIVRRADCGKVGGGGGEGGMVQVFGQKNGGGMVRVFEQKNDHSPIM